MLWDVIWRFKNHFSLFFCVSFSLTSIFWHTNTNPFARGLNYFGVMSDRMSGFMNSGLKFTDGLWVEFGKYNELEQRYERAQKTIEEYRLERDKLEVLRQENERLRNILEFNPKVESETVRAEVLGVRLNSISPRIIINKGSSSGIKPFMPVYTQAHDSKQNMIRAIVGIVASTGENVSVIQPILHPDFKMGVRIPKTGHWAIISGNSGKKGRMIMNDLALENQASNIFRKAAEESYQEDIVLTSGEGGVFPEGIPVGTLEKKISEMGENDSVYVIPLAPIGMLDVVSVILKTPEIWSNTWDKKIDWEEHLHTEFGSPQYPATLSSSKTKKNYREAIKKQLDERKDETNTVEDSNPEKIQERRRLNNLPQSLP